jgi:hypothetical protein
VQLRTLAGAEPPAHEGTGEQTIARINSFSEIRFMKLASALSAFYRNWRAVKVVKTT